MSVEIKVPAVITPSSIVAALQGGELLTPETRPVRQIYGLALVDGAVGYGKLYPARQGGGYEKEAIEAPTGCEWLQVMSGSPAYHAVAVLIRKSF